MANFALRLDTNAEQIADLLQEIGEKKFREARIAAINSAMKTAETQINRAAAKTLGVPQRRLRGRSRLYRATWSRDDSRIFFGTYPFKVMKITPPPRQTREGVEYGWRGKRKFRRGAFIQTIPQSGHRGVFVRAPDVGERKKSDRHGLKIKELKIDPYPIVRAAAEMYLPTLAKVYQARLVNQFEFRVARELARQRINL